MPVEIQMVLSFILLGLMLYYIVKSVTNGLIICCLFFLLALINPELLAEIRVFLSQLPALAIDLFHSGMDQVKGSL